MSEKGLSEVRRSTRELYEKGLAALHKENFDYAIAIFMQILSAEPALFDCRQALRATQFKKNTARSGFFKRVFGSASSSPLLAKGQFAARTDPLEAMRIAESILNGDPQNAAAHKLLAEAALAADLPKTAILSLDIAHKNAPQDLGIALRLAEALARTGQVVRAEQLYAELSHQHPQDQQIAQALKNVSARRTMAEGGYDKVDADSSYRDLLRDKDEATQLEQEQREVKSTALLDQLIAGLERDMAADPANLQIQRKLSDLHAQKREYDRALELLRGILEAQGGSEPSIERAIGELTLRQFDQRAAQIDPQAPDAAAQIERLKAERLALQIEDTKRRVERYPNDLQLRFELGSIYFAAGRHTEAIQELQRAQNNPHIRIKAMHLLGQAFAGRKMYDLAVRTFQNALKEKPVLDEEKKALLYSLGSAFESQGKPQEAVEQYKQIYEADIGYKDVAAKVDAFYSSQ